jgi:hypothetical protein
VAERVAGVHLVRSEEHADEIAALVDRYGEPVGVAGVLDDLNRVASRARVPGRAPVWGFRWDQQDTDSQRWWPQGITSSADATDTEDVDGRRLVVVSWYSKGAKEDNHGSRVTFVDVDALRYRHVLIVKAGTDEHGHSRLETLQIHAGGVVWCGPYLHLAGTTRGLYTCHVDDIMRVQVDDDTLGYRYVLPVRFAYRAMTAESAEQLRYSFMSLDRGVSPPELVAGEYGIKGQTTRLVRYPLDPETQELRRNDGGESHPVFLDDGGVGHMQGAAVVDGTYYVTVSRGPRRLGHLYVGSPGRLRPHRWALPPGPEDISYWPSRDQLWSLCEYPGRRFVYAMDRHRLGLWHTLKAWLRRRR